MLATALGLGLVGLLLKVTGIQGGGSRAWREEHATALEGSASRSAHLRARSESPTLPPWLPAPAGGSTAEPEAGIVTGALPPPRPFAGDQVRPGWVGEPPVGVEKTPTGRRHVRTHGRRARKQASREAREADGGAGGAGEKRQPGAVTQAPEITFDSGDTVYATDVPVEIPEIGKIVSRAGTLSFLMQPAWAEGNQDDATLLEVGDGRLRVVKNVNFLRFEFTDDAGNPGGIGAPLTQWGQDEWHQVTATWNGALFALYMDGELVSQTVQSGGFQLPPDASLRIGSNYPLGRPVAPGMIGRVDVQGRPLGPVEIARQFIAAAGR